MPFYKSVGDIPRKRHTHHFQPDGSRYIEELMGQEGFGSASALLYHRHSPSALVSIDQLESSIEPATADHPVNPRHLRTSLLSPTADLILDRHTLLANADVEVDWLSGIGTSDLYRNADGDELVFVHRGSATIESIFGALIVSQGDYLVIPRSTTHRWITTGIEALVVVAHGHIRPPHRYLSSHGQFLEHSPYCERDIRVPSEPLLVEGENVPVLVRLRGRFSRHVYRHHPFDVAGWDGHLHPWSFNISDFEPIVGRIHQPPPVHQTFEGNGFVVCSFVPRLFDFHPNATKIPYHHSNTDSDEVLFYSDGDFMSRKGSGVGAGSITFHPVGFTHGPQPGSLEASLDKIKTDELAVMIDTFARLDVTTTARSISDLAYPFSWNR